MGQFLLNRRVETKAARPVEIVCGSGKRTYGRCLKLDPHPFLSHITGKLERCYFREANLRVASEIFLVIVCDLEIIAQTPRAGVPFMGALPLAAVYWEPEPRIFTNLLVCKFTIFTPISETEVEGKHPKKTKSNTNDARSCSWRPKPCVTSLTRAIS